MSSLLSPVLKHRELLSMCQSKVLIRAGLLTSPGNADGTLNSGSLLMIFDSGLIPPDRFNLSVPSFIQHVLKSNSPAYCEDTSK